MVPRNFAISRDQVSNGDEQDADYVTKDYADIFGENAIEQIGNNVEDTFFDDGNDAFYKKDETLTFKNKFSVNEDSYQVDSENMLNENESINDEEPKETVSNVGELVDDVKFVLKNIYDTSSNTGPIRLKYIISIADINTVAQSTIQMINSFNQQAAADGIDLSIYPVISSSADEYLQ
ncbi:hypothetical protein Zmor_012045 [Zophobas morio]|uniref:Uncharacterized protein n=1 Tax=Zophobas morio TaxID=2755281 RepID=A0AA38LYM1_9CUCU|nr:hypothetical protein Zmor_012045 [Zophobas morio]